MKIVMTGGNGFIGSHIARQLVQDGHQVTILHRRTSDLSRLVDIKEKLLYADISDIDLDQLFTDSHFDIVIHCATIYSRGNNVTQLSDVMKSNVEFPAHLLYLAKKCACIGFINTCTIFLKYFQENCGLDTHMSLYMLSKKQFREWGEYLASDGEISFLTMQLEHVYGLDDGKGKLIPSLIKAMDDYTDHFDLSVGTQTRDFIAVEDVAKAYSVIVRKLGERRISGVHSIEVGTGRKRTLRNFVELIKEGKQSTIQLNWGKYIPNDKELNSSVADSKELRSFGWKPEVIDDYQIVQYFRGGIPSLAEISMKPSICTVFILGSGIAGLACSQELKRHNIRSTIFEKEKYIGGLCHSFQKDGFTFDSAVHLSFTINEQVRSQFDKVSYLKHNPESTNFYNEQFIKHPILNNLAKLSAEEKCELIESFLKRDEKQQINNYADWLNASYGKEIKERFYDVYTKKYWTLPSEQLSTTWIGSRLNTPDLHKVLYGAFSEDTGNDYYAEEMRYPEKGGYQGFIQPLIDESDIRVNKKVVEINAEEKVVRFADGSIIKYEKLFSSIPLCEMGDLIKNAPQEVKEASSRLQYSMVSTVSVAFSKADVPKTLWMYVYDTDIFAARIHSPSMKSPNNVPEGCSSLQFEIYHHNTEHINKEEILENTRYAIKKMGLADEKDILFMHYCLLPYGNVIFYNGMEDDRKIVLDYVKSCGIIPIGRFGEWEYYWSDQAYMSGVRATFL